MFLIVTGGKKIVSHAIEITGKVLLMQDGREEVRWGGCGRECCLPHRFDGRIEGDDACGASNILHSSGLVDSICD